jgi:hypothetical protein
VRPGGQAQKQQQRQAQHEFDHQAQMHPCQQQIVATIAEVRHTALVRCKVLHRRVDVERPHAAPGEPHNRFGVEVEAAHPGLTAHHIDERRDRVDAKSVKRIGNARTERFQIRPPVRDAPATHPQQRCRRIEHRPAEDHRVGLFGGGAHEGGNQRRRVLAVGVHRQRLGEAGLSCRLQAVQHRGTLALVGRQLEHAQAGQRGGEFTQALRRAIGAAVDHHPDRVPRRAGVAHRALEQRAGVVARNDDELAGAGADARARTHRVSSWRK